MPLDHYGLLAKLYDRAGPYQPTGLLLDLLSLSPGSSLLDAGGGTGRVALALRNMVQRVFVEDTSHDMLRRAAGKGLPAAAAQAEALPFPSESIDRILMVDALHHVKDQRLVAGEFWRVLAPGGRILIVEPDIRKIFVKMIAIGEKLVLMRSHFLTAREITSLFKDPGVRAEARNDGFYVYCVAEKAKRI